MWPATSIFPGLPIRFAASDSPPANRDAPELVSHS